jgi:hypothetical protein
MLSARDAESAVLARCAAAASGTLELADDRREAHVFRVAAMVMRPRFPLQSARLMQASERYFAQHPGDVLETAEVIRKGWLSSLPRLRSMLSRQLQHGTDATA